MENHYTKCIFSHTLHFKALTKLNIMCKVADHENHLTTVLCMGEGQKYVRRLGHRSWTRPGQELDKAGSGAGQGRVRSWTRPGQELDKAGSGAGQGRVTGAGQGPVRSWTRPGQELDKAGSGAGQGPVRSWPQVDTHIVGWTDALTDGRRPIP